ncbi:uncharacterized protein VNE69_09133 [Vairimorpha necatrix]|uniref:Uncharacterized protein n=1 Tax=Vairimorpha necatrix TaxID=6039 RepID=A0AAX4JF12_9MICR
MNIWFFYLLFSTCMNTISLFVFRDTNNETILYMGIDEYPTKTDFCSFEILEYELLEFQRRYNFYEFIPCDEADLKNIEFEYVQYKEHFIFDDIRKNFFESRILLKSCFDVKSDHTYFLLVKESTKNNKIHLDALIRNSMEKFFSVRLTEESVLSNNINGLKQTEKDNNMNNFISIENKSVIEHQQEKAHMKMDSFDVIHDSFKPTKKYYDFNKSNTTGVNSMRKNDKTTEEVSFDNKPVFNMPTIYPNPVSYGGNIVDFQNNSHFYDIEENDMLLIANEQNYDFSSVHQRSIMNEQTCKFKKNCGLNSCIPQNNIQLKADEQIYDIPKNRKQVIINGQIYDIPRGHKLSLNHGHILDIPRCHKISTIQEKIFENKRMNRESYVPINYRNIENNEQVDYQNHYKISNIDRESSNKQPIYYEIVSSEQLYDKLDHGELSNIEPIYENIIYSQKEKEKLIEATEKKLHRDLKQDICTSEYDEGYIIPKSSFRTLTNVEMEDRSVYNLKDNVFDDYKLKCDEQEHIYQEIVSEPSQKNKFNSLKRIAKCIKRTSIIFKNKKN